MTEKYRFQNENTRLVEPWFMEKYPDRPVYALVPERYNPEKPIGLFLFMHGGDTDSPPTTPNFYVKDDGGALRPHIDDIPFITVAPAALPAVDGKRWNRHAVVQYVCDVIDDACTRFNIDRDRIILGGHSMGGFGAYHLAPVLADKVAGLWLSAGAWQQEDFRGCLGTPVYLMHAKWDCAYNYRGGHKCPRHHDWCGVSFARGAHELMLEYDVDHVYDEHTGGHGLNWEPTQLAFQRFLRWAQRQKRNPYASRCAVITPNGSCDPDLEVCRASRWLEVTGTAAGTVKLDKIVLTGPNMAWNADELAMQSFYLTKAEHEGFRLIGENLGDNTFAFQAENITAFKLYLHSKMADLSKPVKLLVNNVEFTLMPEAVSNHPDYEAQVTLTAPDGTF